MGKNTFFFIPDISGFTKFINETEISHSQHIIQEMLELLVDSNSIGLTVSEFEGDAIFFYRNGASPQANELAEQARKMFVNFHSLIKKYETHRLCQCRACKSANQLTLKFIAHYGEANSYTVKEHSKLIGKDVILVHRLLKNSVNYNEYLLLSEALLNASGSTESISWFKLESGADSYDEIGNVNYKYSSLTPLLKEVTIEPVEEIRIENPVKIFECEELINAPMEDIFAVLIDIPARSKWMANVKEVIVHDKMPNHTGTVHKCITGGDDQELFTGVVKVTDKTMEFTETSIKKIYSCRYYLEETEPGKTLVKVEAYIKKSIILKLMMKLFMLKKIKSVFLKSAANLKTYCEKNKGMIK